MNKEDQQRLKEILKQYPIVSPLINCKGQFATVKWRKKLKTYKDIKSEVVKEGVLNCRAGLSHNERRDVLIARIIGDLPVENIGLMKGMKWSIFPFFIETSTGKLLTRLYPTTNHAPQYKYFLNGFESDEETARQLCLASEFSEHNLKIGCINVTTDYIQEVIFND